MFLTLILAYKFWILGALALYMAFRGTTPVGTAMRVEPKPGVPVGERWYIESLAGKDTPVHSCSFVEFDGHGDYIDFEQHKHAWHKVEELAKQQPVLLITYCHGWKNNSQSSDVVKFSDFLGRVAASQAVHDYGYRVHGIYLGWRGNLYHPHIEKDGETHAYTRTAERFGGPVVSTKWARGWIWPRLLQENLSYWSRRRAAEHNVSSVPMARTVYTCASLVKSMDQDLGRNLKELNSSRVLILGHSFGGLMLERALNATCLDPLMDDWAWFSKDGDRLKDTPVNSPPSNSAHSDEARTGHLNPLPLDFVLFINSAAPSVYAKEMRDFLKAHQSALVEAHSEAAYTPVFVSLTSSADWATGVLHPLANLFSRFYPSLRRKYSQLVKIPGRCDVNQSWFYRRTPGHQPLLVDHWLEECGPVTSIPADLVEENLNYETDQPLQFWAKTAGRGGKARLWKLSLQPAQADRAWASKFGKLEPSRCSYWFIRCDKRIIRDHNDVWSDTAMQVYAALYRLVEWARNPQNPQSNQVFKDYWDGK